MVNRPKTDLTGRVFNRLTVQHFVNRNKWRKALWSCLCTCGNITVLAENTLLSGNTGSCGCLHKESQATRAKTHGDSRTPEHIAWKQMRGRVLNPNHQNYDLYKDRHISPEFEDYAKFLEHVGRRPSSKHSLDRIDNAKGYLIGNLRWATKLEQSNNMSSNRLLRDTITGELHSIAEAARRCGIARSTLSDRLNDLKWSADKATYGVYTEGEQDGN